MVAISLYRGNLHRVPDVPRRWLMPNRTISMKDFRCLLRRRSLALSRSLPATTSNPDRLKGPSSDPPGDAANRAGPPTERELKKQAVADCREGTSKIVGSQEEKDAVEDPRGLDGGPGVEKAANGKSNAPEKESVAINCSGAAVVPTAPPEKLEEPVKLSSEPMEKADTPSDTEKRKKEVEEKLQVLNAKKHNLVQVLKQILNAEEELKRRSSMPGMATRPSVPLQVDVTNDSGSMTRHPTPRAGPEGNQGGGDVEAGEAEDATNHNILSRPLLRLGSTSPLESPLRRPALSQLNAVPHSSRTSLGVIVGSPSRFAPQGHPPNLPGVSLSGTNYIASSPSPAASGGTSAFKDVRQPSPWN